MSKIVLIDFEKIKDPYSGLGQFCTHLKYFFDKSTLPLKYFIPNKFEKLAKKIPLLIPYSKVFHAVHQDSPYMPWSKNTSYVLTIHDLNALYEKSQYGNEDHYKKNLQKKINRADKIIYISEFTKNEVESVFQVESSKTEIIYNGISLQGNSQLPKYRPQKPFLFTIGTVLPKKNFHVLIGLMELATDLELIIAGTTYHQYAKDLQSLILEKKLENRVRLIGTINEGEKLWHYQNAKAFIFPSLLEGFGLPVAEAMSFGLPLFLSNKTSLPEIGGPDAFYFQNFEKEYMFKVLQDGFHVFSSDQKARLIKRSHQFNWEKAANSYLRIYDQLLK